LEDIEIRVFEGDNYRELMPPLKKGNKLKNIKDKMVHNTYELLKERNKELLAKVEELENQRKDEMKNA
jgi:hypothetical protein